MNKFVHIVKSEFDRNVGGRKVEWWAWRLKILKHFTLKSLANQTEKSFHYVMFLRHCFPTELYPELNDILEKSGLKYSIIYYDIKDDLQDKLRKHLSTQYVYVTRIDTDDMFHKEAIAEIQSYEFGWRRALIFQKGYRYGCVDKKMQHYKMPSPPFFTRMFPTDIYLDDKKRADYLGQVSGHDQVLHKFNSIILSENNFLILVHGKNERSFDYVEMGESEIFYKEHSKILDDFSITETTYSKMLKDYENRNN